MKKIIFFSLVCFLFLFNSNAQAVTGLGLGVRGGIIQNYDNPGIKKFCSELSLTKMPLLGAHLKIGTLPYIDLEVSVEYAWKKKKGVAYKPHQIVDDVWFNADFTVRDLSLNATAKYLFSFPVVRPYIGAGIGIHRLIYELSVADTLALYFPEDENKIGFHGVGGVSLQLPAFPLEIFVEGRFVYIKTKQKKLDTKETDFITILAGITLNF